MYFAQLYISSYFSGYQQNMSTPYGGNQGAGNPYNQGGYPSGQNAGYGSGGYPPSGQQPYGVNQYAQNPGAPGTGYPSGQSSGYAPGGYPPSGQQPYGANQYAQAPGAPGTGYPPIQNSGYAPNSGNFMSNEQRTQRLNQVVQQYEINQQFAARLQSLGNCEIVVLCDDSGSMNTPLQGTNQTRWDELKSVCSIHEVFSGVTRILTVVGLNTSVGRLSHPLVTPLGYFLFI